jgi:hypothetical protein
MEPTQGRAGCHPQHQLLKDAVAAAAMEPAEDPAGRP